MNRELGGGIFVAAALLATALGIGACGSPNTHQSKAAYEHAEAAKYLAVVAPFDAADNALLSKSEGATPELTVAQFKDDCAPLLAAAGKLDRALLRMGLTGRAAVDARALVASNTAFIAVFHALAPQNIQAELPVLEQDNAVSTADGNRLRADLGLHPVDTGA
ncbi:MAG: hypothetical protein ABSG36_15270 [Acidimicrobiales bacterium]|jgi:hypothetical protein